MRYLIRYIVLMAVVPVSITALQPLAGAQEKKLADNPQLVLITRKGEITMELFTEKAPEGVGLLLDWVRKGVYNDGVSFQRYAENFVIQASGQPKINEPYQKATDERLGGLPHIRGALGLPWERENLSSRFYLCLDNVPKLDGRHLVVGQVREGLDILQELRPGDEIMKITIKKTKPR